MPTTESFGDDTEKIVDAALAEYDLPDRLQVTPIRVLKNSVHAVTTADGRRFALRLHRDDRAAEHIIAELTFLAAVHERIAAERVEVPAPVPATDGRLMVTVDLPTGPAHCDLLTWVPGKARRPGDGFGVRGVHQLGRALAHVHRASAEFDAPPGFTLPRWDAATVFAGLRGTAPVTEFVSGADLELLESVAARTEQVFASLGTGRDAYGLIHNDFILGNCHSTRSRPHAWQIGVLDFDDSAWGHYLYDFAPMMGNLSDYPHYTRLREAFLAGYRTARPLPGGLEAHLPVLMAARHAYMCLWAAGLSQRPGDPEFDKAFHIDYRLGETRRCLAMSDTLELLGG